MAEIIDAVRSFELTTLSPGCFTKQFNSAFCPTMAVTFRGAISSKFGLFKGSVDLLSPTTLARLGPPETNTRNIVRGIVPFLAVAAFLDLF